MGESPPPLRRRVREGGEPTGDELPPVRLGPVKFLLDERTTDPEEIKARVAEARAAGHAVAIHAVSEAEVAIAVTALAGPPHRSRDRSPNRIEHGSVIPNEMLADLRAAHITVVGQPALISLRGDVYLGDYPPESHGWLHRAASLVAAGIGYAAGSDAPIGDPSPFLGFRAARTRVTPSGAVLGPEEALATQPALAAFTQWPAQAIGASHDLGTLSPGKSADIAVLDPDMLGDPTAGLGGRQARLTLVEGRIAWRRT